MTKGEYFEFINELLDDKIYITDKLDEFLEETGMNQCTLKIDSKTARNIENFELSEFLNDVIKNRKGQLEKSNKDVDLLFYSWFDDLSGYLHFDLINSKHESLPFQSKIILADSIDQIVEKFLDPDYLDYLTKASLEELENDQRNKEDIVYVYKEVVKKRA